ncbi:esterase [Novimethylophilus kurashikiensis]|uniref:Esterase n=1 Tax=Novimethylophilus kurashikiensis TaxID=1825523 RepID=A0A2R5FDA0_9PROT|nr:alpha/beta hydrolase [Novimethylophilus kurashikiensis]GBG15789.1 esterase [Novimethylophilus kurashikiensis]
MRLFRSPATLTPILILLLTLLSGAQAQAGTLRDRLANQLFDRDPFAEEASSATVALPSGSKVLKDLSYGGDPLQRMDVYLPSQAIDAPVILMIHGGGWRRGDKAMATVVENKVRHWLPQGFIFVSANYRLLPQADPLKQGEDVARALAEVQSRAKQWGGDPHKVILMGHSAGAHLVALLTASPDLAYAQGAKPWLGTVSLDSAAIDVVDVMKGRHYRLYDPAFGNDEDYWKAASPMQQLSSKSRPLLLVCSSIRSDHPCDASRRYVERASTIGVRAELLAQPLSHKAINQDLGLQGDYTEAVEQFMEKLAPGQLHSRLQ